MALKRRYSDPTMGFDKYSSIKYSTGGEVAGQLMPYASNIVNSFRKLPKPIAPTMESGVAYTPVAFDADRVALNNQVTNASRETDYKLGNRSIAQAIKAKMKAGAMLASNDLSQKEATTNAMLRSRYDELNQGVQVRNLARQQQFNDQSLSRLLKEQELDSENLADFGNKYQLSQKDKSLKDLESRKLFIQSLGIDRSLLGEDSTKALDSFIAEERAKLGTKRSKRFGGRLKRLA